MVSGSESRGRIGLPAATPQENAILATTVQLANEQLAAVRRQASIQSYLTQQYPDLFSQVAKTTPALEPGAFAPQIEALRGDLSQSRADISTAAENALRLGTSDITNARQLALQDVRDIVAPSRGLRPGDAPILDAAGRISAESLRQQGQLASSIRGQEAQALSQLPFERGLATTQLQTALANQAFQNRLSLVGMAGQTTLGLNPNVNVPGALSVVQAPRLAQPRTNQSQFGYEISGQQIGQLIGGIASAFACWVAAEYYGWFTPEWWDARTWILERWQGPVAKGFRAVYLRHGKRLASWVRRYRIVRVALRPVFEWARRKGSES